MGPWAVVLLQFCFCLLLARLIIHIQSRRRGITRKTMIVLGSGGHTSEMFKFLSTLDERELKVNFNPRHYIIANTDLDSEDKALEFEANKNLGSYVIHRIPRSREVGQSFFTSIFSTLKAFVFSFIKVAQIKPEIILANGPGTCLPICVSGFITKIIGITPCCCIALAESYACISHPSLTTKLLHPIVDVLFVQWTGLLKLYPSAIYSGRLPVSTAQAKKRETSSFQSFRPKKIILVTVGSTRFEKLIDTVDTLEFGALIQKLGYNGIHIQHGTGKAPTTIPSLRSDTFEVVVFSRKPSLIDEIRQSSLIIGHAGVGTIFDSLENQRDILVVPNTALMNNHQTEIAKEMVSRGYLKMSSCESLHQDLTNFDAQQLYEFPKTESSVWKSMIHRHSGLYKMPSDPKNANK